MRVHVEADMTVNHNTNVVTLKAGQIVEGPLAVFLVESDCAVTIEHDDRPGTDPAPIEDGATGDTSAKATKGSAKATTKTKASESAETAPPPAAEPGA